ncbi:uncharacterized protein aftphb [Kryptolebias marmoratus]|uniref:uncharacterized protein aftphb n=1 Tax=Kryptolebias marmoratus TaxID=37003 RepID=UPI0007F8794A|nr:uncharacterized protein aftphb [Kryptolebias marmoratus]XP_017283084.1 uncharacterized protein aftphb [Kryptolebias marmoratus]XP_024864901.1 uncharacterized protein aftphb [Kryptolebias marmoratus]XP_037829425.1 uncharacterized protein aftphb [Kryptolebias marmoratus]
MEPDMSSLSHSPLPLDGGVGSEEDEFGDFASPVVCSALGLADATEPPSFLRQAPPALKPATRQPNSSFNPPADESQRASAAKSGSDRRRGPNCNPEPSLHYSNGHAAGDLKSGAFRASSGSSPVEETGFADFTLFTEQAGHPWCCGFTERWDGKAEGAKSSPGEHACSLRRDGIMESEPKAQHRCKADVRVNVKHCEKNAVLPQPPQDHRQPQEAAAASSVASAEEQRIPGNAQEQSCNSQRSSEVHRLKDGDCQTSTEDEPASADQASCRDGLSFQRASAELEPQVSPPASQADQTDSEAEEAENCGRSVSPLGSGMANLGQSEPHLRLCSRCMTQETSATSGSIARDERALLADGRREHHGDGEPVQTADAGTQRLGNLPQSDSFADFCSAPAREDEEGPWADFKHQSVPVEGKTWTRFREPENRATRRNSCQAPLSCRVRLLLQSSFPEVLVPAVEGEEEPLNLGALLQTQDLPESEEAIPELSRALRIQQLMLRPHQDVYRSLGLQFQWGGSRANTSLLSCLGVDARNNVFMATKKPPVTVSTYVTGLGMLDLSPHSAQALPWRQLNWSSRSLSSSQEGTSPCRAPHM